MLSSFNKVRFRDGFNVLGRRSKKRKSSAQDPRAEQRAGASTDCARTEVSSSSPAFLQEEREAMSENRVRSRQSVKQFGRKDESWKIKSRKVRRSRSICWLRTGPLFALVGGCRETGIFRQVRQPQTSQPHV